MRCEKAASLTLRFILHFPTTELDIYCFVGKPKLTEEQRLINTPFLFPFHMERKKTVLCHTSRIQTLLLLLQVNRWISAKPAGMQFKQDTQNSLQWPLLISNTTLLFHPLINLFQGAGWWGRTICKHYSLSLPQPLTAPETPVWCLWAVWVHCTDVVSGVLYRCSAWCAGVCLHQLLRVTCDHLFQTPCLAIWCC